MAYKGKRGVRWLALLLALVTVFVMCGTQALAAETQESGTEESAAAESSTEESGAVEDASAVPDPSANFYIHDEEKLLSNETKNEILARNKELYEKYGIQIIVLSLAQIPGSDVNAKGAYLHQIIDSWQVGGTSEKCLVVMLSAAEQNYVAVAGEGLKTEFPVSAWNELFNQYLETDFAAQQYDAGALKLFKAIADKAELYAVNTGMTATGEVATPTPEPSAEPEEEKEEKDKPGVFTVILRVIGGIILAALAIMVIGFIVIYTHGQMVRKKRREARRRQAMQARAQRNDGRSPTQNTGNDYNDFINRY